MTTPVDMEMQMDEFKTKITLILNKLISENPNHTEESTVKNDEESPLKPFFSTTGSMYQDIANYLEDHVFCRGWWRERVQLEASRAIQRQKDRSVEGFNLKQATHEVMEIAHSWIPIEMENVIKAALWEELMNELERTEAKP